MRADRFPFTGVFLSQQGTGHYLQGVPRWTKSLRDMIFFRDSDGDVDIFGQ